MDNGWKSAKPTKKTQAEKRADQRMRNSWFTQQYEAYGENFANFKNPENIRRESNKIFISLANNAIDITKHGKCFEDPIFVNALKDIAYEKMVYHHVTSIGLQQFINTLHSNGQQAEAFIYNTLGLHQRAEECYTLLYNAFSNIILTRDYLSVLATLMPLLNKYKNSLYPI